MESKFIIKMCEKKTTVTNLKVSNKKGTPACNILLVAYVGILNILGSYKFMLLVEQNNVDIKIFTVSLASFNFLKSSVRFCYLSMEDMGTLK